MPLQNRDEHIRCRYYATEHTALFQYRRFEVGDVLPAISRERGVLIYVCSGSMEVVMGSFPPEVVGSQSLMFLPQNVSFYGRAVGALELCTCVVPHQIPLCSRYDLVDLQQDLKNLNKGKLPPPKSSANNC